MDNIDDDSSDDGVRYHPRCGRRNTDGVGIKIEGATSAQFGEWPHMCMLFRAANGPDDFSVFECGASLVAPGMAMTAAHCIRTDEDKDATFVVRCGEWDTKGARRELYPHQDREVMKVTLHPSYNPENHENDMALLHLRQEFELEPHIDTICLPDEDLGRDGYSDEGCYAAGWGKEDFSDSSKYQTLLQHVELPIVPREQCQDAFRTTKLGSGFTLHESFMCAGGEEGNDTCKGDGGGPLMCPSTVDPTIYVQVGVTAWGIGCGTEGIPGAYSSILDASCFIRWTTQCYYGDR